MPSGSSALTYRITGLSCHDQGIAIPALLLLSHASYCPISLLRRDQRNLRAGAFYNVLIVPIPSENTVITPRESGVSSPGEPS